MALLGASFNYPTSDINHFITRTDNMVYWGKHLQKVRAVASKLVGMPHFNGWIPGPKNLAILDRAAKSGLRKQEASLRIIALLEQVTRTGN